MMLTHLFNDEVHENVLWPDLPYVTDEHGSKSKYWYFLFFFQVSLFFG